MAAVGHTAASTGAVRGSSGCTCPRFFSDKFHLEHLDHRRQRGPTFAACRGARQPPGLELSAPPPQPPHGHALTGAHSYPPRSLDGRRQRRQRPRLHGRRSSSCSAHRCRRSHPLGGPPRPHERVTLVRCVRTYAVHVHALYRLLTLTTSLGRRCTALALHPHRPWAVYTRLSHLRRRTGRRSAAAVRS